jgi:uncharacterized protein
MHGEIRHFAINADDVPATRRFYETLFGWTFEEPFGPGFLRTTSAGAAVGAIQARRALLPDARTTGFECTFAVDDVDATARAVVASGGRVVMDKSVIPGVGELIFFADPSGNVAGAMRFA